jgi:NADH:ubiquinone oxidoreductase subunit 6 (subunit J)
MSSLGVIAILFLFVIMILNKKSMKKSQKYIALFTHGWYY